MDQDLIVQFQEFLLIIGRLEKKAEVKRERLCELNEFEPFTIFQLLDVDDKKYIDIQDLWIFLQQNEMDFSSVEGESGGQEREQQVVEQLIQEYDQDQDGVLNYDDFLGMALPRDNIQLRTNVSNRRHTTQHYHENVENALFNLFQTEINNVNEINILKSNFNQKQVESVFRLIDQENNNQINSNDLNMFFSMTDHYLYAEEIQTILTRIHKSQVQFITKQSFVQFMQAYVSFAHNNQNNTNQSSIYQQQQSFTKTKQYNQQQQQLQQQQQKSHNQNDYMDYMINKMSTNKSTTPYKNNTINKSGNKSQKSRQVEQFQLDTQNKNKQQNSQSEFSKSKKQQQQERIQESEQEQSLQHQQQKEVEYILQHLIGILQMEKEIERTKQELALRPDFNLIDFFILIDQNQKGYLFFQELVDFLEDNRIDCISIGNVQLFYERFSEEEIQMKFSQFANAFTPQHLEYADILNNRKPAKNDKPGRFTNFTKGTQNIIIKIFNQYLQNEFEIEGMRQDIDEQEIDLREIYQILDGEGNNRVDIGAQLTLFTDRVYSQKDISYLINRFDKDNSGQIKEHHFIQELVSKAK